ncbi:hypothetical protein M758_3G087900 [Ceratodon purpureus]|nr:hypothetical protein M758_3G087900 [Ceratodon purpureus]
MYRSSILLKQCPSRITAMRGPSGSDPLRAAGNTSSRTTCQSWLFMNSNLPFSKLTTLDKFEQCPVGVCTFLIACNTRRLSPGRST